MIWTVALYALMYLLKILIQLLYDIYTGILVSLCDHAITFFTNTVFQNGLGILFPNSLFSNHIVIILYVHYVSMTYLIFLP